MAEIVIILMLILLNGVLAATEFAVLSVRRPVLASQAESGDARARSVLGLLDNTNAFLSTIQVGITLVSMLAGAFGGASVVGHLAPHLAKLPVPGAETSPWSSANWRPRGWHSATPSAFRRPWLAQCDNWRG
jgi:putative hemolysin